MVVGRWKSGEKGSKGAKGLSPELNKHAAAKNLLADNDNDKDRAGQLSL